MLLRPYQTTAITEICQNWHNHQAVLYQGATGSGKTEIAKTILDDCGVPSLFVVHRQELLEQNLEIFKDSPNVTIAMVQTLARRDSDLSQHKLIVIDEAHHTASKQYAKLFSTDAKILGLTATPRRLDGKALGDKFQALVKGPTIKSLIEDGYLAVPEIYVPQDTARLVAEHQSEWKVTAGDFNKKSMNQFFEDNRKKIYGDVLEHYRLLCTTKPTLVFCPNVQSVYDTVSLFTDHHIAARGIDGSIGAIHRKIIVEQFKEGSIPILVSCDLISEGFDLPDAYAAIMLRPTKSLTIYLQQAGRVLRMKEDKHKCIIIDHVNNTERFGPPWIERYWSLEGYGERKKRDTITGINLKLCTVCGNYIKSSCLICPHCGKVFKSKIKAFQVIYENLQKITIESAQKLIEKQCQKILNREKYGMRKTFDQHKAYAEEQGWPDPVGSANRAMENDRIYFEGTRDELIAMYARKKSVADPVLKADEVLDKRAEYQDKRKNSKVVQVYETGTLEEIVEFLKVNRTDINNPEAYAKGVLRKRLSPVLENGTEAQKSEAQVLSTSGQVAKDKFEQMLEFAKSGKMQNDDGTPKVLSDEEAEKFARNVVRKSVKAELESGDPVRVRAAVEKLHVHNVDKYVETVLAGDK